mgnify:CR=1 FL=1
MGFEDAAEVLAAPLEKGHVEKRPVEKPPEA